MQTLARAVGMTKPNRVEHDYEPKTPTQVFFRRSTPKEPPEIVIGYNGRQYPYQLTWELFRNLARDLCGMYFASVKPDGTPGTQQLEPIND